MAYIARRQSDTPSAAASGVYASLRELYESEAKEWVANRSRAHHDGAPFPCQRILDGLRAGRAVNVPAGVLREPARSNAPRAIVGPDDTVTFDDDRGAAIRLWLEENDL